MKSVFGDYSVRTEALVGGFSRVYQSCARFSAPAPKPPRLSRRETTLLLKVNSGPPAEWHRQYKKLIEKRRSHGLSADEQRSLLRLIGKMERYDVKRMEWLTELANLRRLPLRALIKSLGLKTPEYV